jgi:DNA replication and repair protein RecF
LAGNPLSLADAARILPAQIIEPGSHRLLEEGPAWRRRYLDWGLFHVEPSFFPAWRRYQRALRQRNQVLRQGGSRDLVRAWDPDLAEAGELMHSLRAALVEKLLVPLGRMVRQLLDTDAWQLELSRGWSSEESLAETLVSGYSRDLSQGQTMHGPHRAELKLRLHDHAARNRVSRGQQKLLVCALALAQTSLVSEAAGVSPVLLLDDFSAELGAEFQRRLAVALSSYRGQQVVTATDRAAALGAPAAVFHVEHGRVERLA